MMNMTQLSLRIHAPDDSLKQFGQTPWRLAHQSHGRRPLVSPFVGGEILQGRTTVDARQ